MGRLRGKKLIVTGGSKGIGAAIVRNCCEQGAQVVFSYSNSKQKADELVRQLKSLGNTVHCIQSDCFETESVTQLTEFAEFKMGGVDVLVNNIGIIARSSFTEIQEQEFHKILHANFKYPFFLSQTVVKTWLQSGAKKLDDKSIINISSLSAQSAISRVSHYQCSKAALSMLTKSLALELSSYGIRVNTISPGLTETSGNQDQRENSVDEWSKRVGNIPLGRAGYADEIANAVVYFASDESTYTTGSDLIIDGGLSTI